MRQVFNNGEFLLAEEVQQLQDEAVIVVANDTERNALPSSCKTCWQTGVLYRRNGGGTWEAVASSLEVSNVSTALGAHTHDAPTTTGGGASGTWAINITGTSGYTANSDMVDGYHANQFAFAGHTHTRHAAGYNISAHWLGSIGSGGAAATPNPWSLPHGLGQTPGICLASMYGDNGVQSVVVSLGVWDATHVSVYVRNLGNNTEDCGVVIAAFM